MQLFQNEVTQGKLKVWMFSSRSEPLDVYTYCTEIRQLYTVPRDFISYIKKKGGNDAVMCEP